METKTALKSSLKYNLVAFVPTTIALVFIGYGLFLIIGQPVLELMELLSQSQPEEIIQTQDHILNEAIAASSPIFGILLMSFGYIIHRVGRTFLLLYIFGKDLQTEIIEELPNEITDETSPENTDSSKSEETDNRTTNQNNNYLIC